MERERDKEDRVLVPREEERGKEEEEEEEENWEKDRKGIKVV